MNKNIYAPVHELNPEDERFLNESFYIFPTNCFSTLSFQVAKEIEVFVSFATWYHIDFLS
jgi:hypothetical protein